ncbi:FliI/YscN family ATPase [Lignipirellula cremea]|uniref:Flagellum-specific ATP synthase n=1 Tax=Lignipirellula cremea TaxID=2528010 RepID=A0A518DRW4_9BACT|nr:FliI/YscN family ATPase [Lignipirellula cremea]QDU94585.1 Flagellum-specific ATP synthase [Lignipirellula cremea]
MSDDLHKRLSKAMPTGLTGSVAGTEGMTITVAGFSAPVGAEVEIDRQAGGPIRGEVIGFRNEQTIVFPFADLSGVRRGNRVRLLRTTRAIKVGEALLGRVIDAHGEVIDGGPKPALFERADLRRQAPPAVQRPRIHEVMSTGIKAIDGLLTCGRGQRMGLFAGSGVGKSVTLGMMARYTSAEVNVIGLIGERGREVNEFIERDLGPEGLARSVVVVATSDEPALTRVQAAMTATAVAEHFRDAGRDVLLMMDSLTRFAMAQREIGLAAGEPPATRGYPPSVFALLPKLVERAGLTAAGAITAFYTVLVEGDDSNEPVSDTVRGLIDGHTFLTRRLAAQGHFPAIDVLQSISRLMTDIVSREHLAAAQNLRSLLAAHHEHEDLISIGAYRAGANAEVDAAIALQPAIRSFLRQAMSESSTVETARNALMQLAQQREALRKP